MSTREYGPVELITIGFTTEQPPAGVIDAVVALAEDDAVAVLDVFIVSRGEDGTIDEIEIDDVGDGSLGETIELGLAGLASEEDVEAIAATLAPGSSALVAAVELTWAARLAHAIREVDAVIVSEERIPAAAVNDALAAIELSDEQE